MYSKESNSQAVNLHATSQVAEQEADFNQKSLLSQRLDRLRDATLGIIRRREKLPQPFFWSLFYSEVSEIKKKKHQQREYDRTVLGLNRM